MNNIFKIVATINVLVIMSAGCKKNTFDVPYNLVDTTAHVKINFASTYTTGTNRQIKIDGIRIGSLASTNANLPFPGGAYNVSTATPSSQYLSISPGTHTLSISIPKSINDMDTALKVSNVDSVLLYSTSINIPDYGYYTIHIADTADLTKAIIVKNDLNAPDSGYFRMKFVNLVPNSTAVDFYYYIDGVKTKVASNVLYMGVSPVVDIPSRAIAPMDVISAGLSSSASSIASMSSTLPNVNQRVYTAYVKGYKLAASGPRVPVIGIIYDK